MQHLISDLIDRKFYLKLHNTELIGYITNIYTKQYIKYWRVDAESSFNTKSILILPDVHDFENFIIEFPKYITLSIHDIQILKELLIYPHITRIIIYDGHEDRVLGYKDTLGLIINECDNLIYDIIFYCYKEILEYTTINPGG